jgi:hypothetical protein
MGGSCCDIVFRSIWAVVDISIFMVFVWYALYKRPET